MKLKDKDPRLNEQIDEIEEMTSRQIAVLEKITDEKIAQAPQGRRTASGRHQAGEVLHRHEAQAVGRRQDGRPPRQQGRDRAHRSGRGHAVSAGWNAGRDRAESAGRSHPYERRTDSGNALGLGGAGAGPALRDAGVRRRDREGHQGAAEGGAACRAPARSSCTTA